MSADSPPDNVTRPRRLRLSLVLAIYAGCVAFATRPSVLTFGSTLPSQYLSDPLAHLWTLRWYKSCLLQGRSPFFCEQLQHPIGAPLGYLPPMHLQALFYIPLSFIIKNDVLIYNMLWFSAFLFTGLGTFVLARRVLRDDRCAFFAGLTAMLSGPMTYFGRGELEQITLGGFPLFLVGWMRWVDRPSRRGMMLAVALYLLLAMSAPYYAVFGVIPAALYVLWSAARAGRAERWSWWKARLGGFAGFLALATPGLALLFSSQLWAILHGFPTARFEAEFARYGASLWGYVIPRPPHLIYEVIPNFWSLPGIGDKVGSYLGLVTIGLLLYAACNAARFPRASYWWLLLATLVILSVGAYGMVGTHRVPLPALWLRKVWPMMRAIRVPARFNLPAAVFAAVVAGAGLKLLLQRIQTPRRRAVVFGLLTTLALADLSMAPYKTLEIPPPPPCYDWIKRQNPEAVILDAPQINLAYRLNALMSYWQSFHGLRTSAGYTATIHVRHDDLTYYNSPFSTAALSNPGFLAHDGPDDFDLARGVSFEDYAWVYLRSLGFDYVVLHKTEPTHVPPHPLQLDRLRARLAPALVYEDERSDVYDCKKLAPPTRPVLVCLDGWRDRLGRRKRYTCTASKSTKIMAYSPEPDRPLTFTLEAAAHRRARTVRLLADSGEIARWTIQPGDAQSLTSPPFRLGPGLRELHVESDAEERSFRIVGAPFDGDGQPFSLWVSGLTLKSASDAPERVAGSGPERK